MRLFLFCFIFPCLLVFSGPQAVYLTLPEDPAHSISIHWIEKLQKGIYNTLLYQRDGDLKWSEVEVSSSSPLGGSTFLVKSLLLKGLDESTYYSFQFKGDEEKFLFRTLPSNLNHQIKIAIGGDFTESTTLFRKMNKVASSKNPDFAILGGDIAYSCGQGLTFGNHGSAGKWVYFFKEWQKIMTGERGRLIPVVAVVGNHDVTSTDRKEKGENSYFLKLFPGRKGGSYQTVDVAGGLSLLLLDSGHLFPIQDEQTVWLEKALKEKEKNKWIIPIYHVAGYPSVYLPSTHLSAYVREYWVPLFEKYGVKLAFEHHNHSYKRTYPLLKDKIDYNGIVYIGDGGWGVPPRKGENKPFYLERSEASNNFSLLKVNQDSLQVEAYNIEGVLIDKWELKTL
jgi:acid phosphatase type 7